MIEKVNNNGVDRKYFCQTWGYYILVGNVNGNNRRSRGGGLSRYVRLFDNKV